MVKVYYINYLLDVVYKNVNIPSEYSLKVGVFVRTSVVDRDYVTFLSVDKRNCILAITCTCICTCCTE